MYSADLCRGEILRENLSVIWSWFHSGVSRGFALALVVAIGELLRWAQQVFISTDTASGMPWALFVYVIS